MNKVLLTSLITILLFGIKSTAQTSTYGFSAFNDTYTPVSASATSLPILWDDDATATGIPIGFPFTYCGVSYSTLSACTNGWVSLINTSDNFWDNEDIMPGDGSGAAGKGLLMPFWDDLSGLDFGDVAYETTGLPGSQVFTIEWQDWPDVAEFGFMFFQVKLYEGTNVIEFRYTNGDYFGETGTIGIANDNISDWRTLPNSGIAPIPTTTFITSIDNSPADGQVYRWAPCSPGTITGTGTLCVGSTTTLSNSVTGGTWSSSTGSVAAVGVGGVVTGVGTGTSTITYTVGTGCYTTTVVTVAASPAPITGTLLLCAGATSSLSAAVTGGTWASGSTIIAVVDGATGVVTGSSAGTSVITYTTSGGCTATAIVTVSNSPSAITGALTLCVGSATTLSSSPTGGTWVSTAPGVATITSGGVVNALTAGTTTISYTISSGCSATAVLTVVTTPSAITGSAIACVGASTVLGDAVPGGTFSSSTTGVATIGPATGIVTGVSAGTTTITYAVGASCFVTQVLTVVPVPAPVSGVFTVCEGAVTTLSTTGTGGTWVSGATGTATVGSLTGIVTGVLAGNVTISYVVGTSCFVSAIITVKPLPAAITGLSSVCVGNTTTYTDATTPGNWISGTPAVATIDPVTGIITGVTAGTSLISYVVASGCYVTKVITVNAPPPAIGGTLSVCVGSVTTLTDATTGGTWTSGTTGVATIGASAGDVTGVTTGTSIITYRAPSGCSVTAIVTVNPGAAAITGTTTVCAGATTTLSNTSTGTWSSGTPAVATIGAGTGIVTGVIAGTSVITFTTTSGCTRTAIVSVNPLPAAIGGTLSVCSGLTTTLTNTSTGGTWTSSNALVATVGASSGVVTGIATTTSTTIITYTISTGCQVTAIVSVNPSPAAITGTLSVCAGQTTTLADATAGGTWSSGTLPVAAIGSSSGIVTGGVAGTSIITYKLSGGCTSTAIVTVYALPGAITGATSVCIGSTVTLASTPAGGTWLSSVTANATIGASSGIVTGVAAGTTIITYTSTNGCTTTRTESVNAIPNAITGTAVVCPGATTTLSTTSTGGAWTSGNTGIATVGAGTGIVTGVTGGTAIISYTVSGCSSTRIVSVSASPAAIGGILSVCIGTSTTLTDASGAGTWTSGNTGIATAGLSTGIVTGVTAGNTNITFVLTSTGCQTTSVITVNPLPTVIGGTLTVCAGSITTLTNGTSGGNWTSGTPAVATVGASNGAVAGVASGTSIITYSLGSGCNVTATVTVNPLPAAITGTFSICLGTPVTMGNTTAGGTWSSSATGVVTIGSSTAIATGVATGNATITYALNTGCNVRQVVTVNPLPAAITGPASVCAAGASVTLSNATTGGTWTSGAPAIASIGASTGIVTGLTNGTATITYTIGTGCFSTLVVTVNGVPAAIITPIGDTTFCPGGFVALTATTGSGLTYKWFKNGVFIPAALSSTYVATTGGSYQVQVTSGLGCTTMSAPMLVTVDGPSATISVSGGGAAVTCAGTALTFDANTGTGYSYQWLQDGAAITGAVGNSYATSVAGDYAVVVSNGTGCSATSSSITLTVNPVPANIIGLSGPLTFCQNDSVVMTAPSVAGYTYQWNTVASGAIAGATNNKYTATAAGSYSVDITNTFGCTSASAVTIVAVNPLPNVAILASGPMIFCTGGSVILSATSATGLTYQWYNGATAIPGATNASYVAATSGGYRVKVTNTATGCSDKTHADSVVTLVSTPTIIPLTPASFCWGGSALLATSVTGATGAVLYQWFKDGVSIPGANGATYSATSAGTYKCDITIVASCTVSTVSTVVTENPLPNPIVTFDGTMFHTAGYYLSYQWYKNLVMISGANTAATPATGDGNYKVAVTDSNGCQSFSAQYVLNGWTGGIGGSTGVVNVNNGDISIYPNPAQQLVHIVCTQDIRVLVQAADGRTVLEVSATKDVDISHLADGVYVLTVYDTAGRSLKTEKLIKASN